MDPILLLIAVGLDLLFGDPRFLHHPVVYIGRLINFLETGLRGTLNNRYLAGILLCVTVLVVSGGVTAVLLWLSGEIHPLLQSAMAIYLAFTTLALRQLHKESREVVAFVKVGDLDNARRSLSLIVGRETAHLKEEEILCACIETVAENTSDGVIAPLFYLFLGGPVLAMLYKATNTLDSMVGYRDDHFREMGRASARFDDLLNLIPARLTGLLMAVAAIPIGLNGWSALKVMLRDARKTSSPNSGFPESAAAGALGIQLGGPAVYFGEKVDKPTLGDPDRPITVASYRSMIQLMYASSFLALFIGAILLWPLQG
jgi:adenosylcobinamide-phosphate synthase